MTLNRFVGHAASSNVDPKQKEATFVAQSQSSAKAVQQVMVLLKDARTNVADPNKVCDKALALGGKITNMVVAFIKTIKQVALTEDGGSTHHVLQMIPADATKIHDGILELQKLLETWILTCRANTTTLRGRGPAELFAAVKELCAQTIMQVKALSDAVINHDVQEFAKRAKEVAVLLSKVIKHAQNKKWNEIGDALLKDAQSLISAGKTAVKNQEAQSDFYQVVNTTLANIKELLRLCKADMEAQGIVVPVTPRGGGGNEQLSLSSSQNYQLHQQQHQQGPPLLSRQSFSNTSSSSLLPELPPLVRSIAVAMPGFRQVWETSTEDQRKAVLASLAKEQKQQAALLAQQNQQELLREASALSPERKSIARVSAVAGGEVTAEVHLADVERGFKATLRDMQRWYNLLRTPFRFWAPNFDKTDYEAIFDRSTDDGKMIAAMVEPIDDIAGRTFLLIVNANLCVGESSGDDEDVEKMPTASRMELVEQPARGLFELLLSLVQSLRKANSNKKDPAYALVTACIGECSKWLEADAPIVGEEDEVTINAASGLFVAGVIAGSLNTKLYHECNRLRVTCIHLCSMLASLRKVSSIVSNQLLQITSAIRVFCESVAELMNTVATQIAVIRKLGDEQRRIATADSMADSAAKKDDIGDMLDAKSLQALELLNQRTEKKSSEAATSISIWRDADDTNVIWEDKAARKGVRAGNLNKLVQELTSTVNYDTSFVQTFVSTYQSFTTPAELFNKLMERYDVPSGMDPKLRQQIRLRVAIVVKHWVENQFADFDQTIITRLYELCKRLEADNQIPMSQALLKLIQRKDEARLAKLRSFLSVPPTDLQIPSGYVNPTELFMMYSPTDIAQQMTIVDFSWFSDIEARELLNQCWSKPKLQYRARNVLGLINRVNILSYWIPSLILWPDKLTSRVQVFEKFIKVADVLRKLGNFSSLMAILAGLGQSSTARLTHTKNALSADAKKTLADLENLMSPQKSFSNYRTALRACKPPAVPYLGVYLQDLTFIEDGNPETLPNASPLTPGGIAVSQLVNFERLAMVYGVLKEVLLFQQQSYGLAVLEPINTLLISLPFATEKNLYEISLLREPRGQTDPSKIL